MEGIDMKLALLLATGLVILLVLWLIAKGQEGLEERLRERDRRRLWPIVQNQCQDRDHAIAWMTLHMAMHLHWWPQGYEDHPSPMFLLIEQALEETAGWGDCGRHAFNVSLPEEDVPPLVRRFDPTVEGDQ